MGRLKYLRTQCRYTHCPPTWTLFQPQATTRALPEDFQRTSRGLPGLKATQRELSKLPLVRAEDYLSRNLRWMSEMQIIGSPAGEPIEPKQSSDSNRIARSPGRTPHGQRHTVPEYGASLKVEQPTTSDERRPSIDQILRLLLVNACMAPSFSVICTGGLLSNPRFSCSYSSFSSAI
ncbi:hypothetical protein BU26DRAFT_168923 [Trematosphaeria pertusa]|uniref:Uncharacterized protein n=1 Tax=Trematosphaeria pertusa TaxID=390896 RepID=A0A6A6HU50_9PLEO|nr:uncharacterized protein BU26DRAFT_168923 [Trematosphaeria pertusa]KAF2241704.1 hypothetical protein BU26DRAFT_168923 [Trematosphaeria pertusa]